MASVTSHRGAVTAFDEARGLGTVVGDDGRAWSFHCTRIADGTRTIDAGTPVIFTVAPGGPGRWEATGLVKLT